MASSTAATLSSREAPRAARRWPSADGAAADGAASVCLWAAARGRGASLGVKPPCLPCPRPRAAAALVCACVCNDGCMVRRRRRARAAVRGLADGRQARACVAHARPLPCPGNDMDGMRCLMLVATVPSLMEGEGDGHHNRCAVREAHACRGERGRAGCGDAQPPIEWRGGAACGRSRARSGRRPAPPA